MAIKKLTSVGNSGMTADHWALADMQIHAGDEPGTTKIVARYGLWLDAAKRLEGRSFTRRTRRITVTVPGINPNLSDIIGACEAELLAETIKPEPGIRAVAAVAAVKGKPRVKANKEKGIEAQVAVSSVPAVKEVAGKRAIRGVRGGELEGGTRV